MSQLSLFGDPPSAASGPGAIPDPDPALVRLADSLPRGLRLGTCSWTFPGWDLVYRREYPSDASFRAESLAEYAAFPLFRAVEIDSSYYRPLSAATLRAYAERLPDDFECAMKVWSEVTTFVFPRHPRFGDRAGMRNPYFLDPAVFAEQVIGPIAEAGIAQLGPLIVEVPPIPAGALEPRLFSQRLSRFLAQAPEGYRYAVEIRDRQLLTRRHLSLLADHGAAHVFTYHARMPSIAEQLEVAGSGGGPLVMCRLMLPPGTRYAEQKARFEPFDRIREPQPAMRADIVRLIDEAGRAGLPVTVLINNKVEGSSPHTAVAIANLVAEPRR
jgi:uncharacterized protein YecE (DUF72 family)